MTLDATTPRDDATDPPAPCSAGRRPRCTWCFAMATLSRSIAVARMAMWFPRRRRAYEGP